MATKVQWVSDEVWETLDPKAGAIRGAELKRLAVGAVLLVVASAAAATLWVSGLAYPRLTWSYAVGYGGAAGYRTFSTDVDIVNDGWTDVRITGVGQDGPGLRLIGVSDRPHISTDAGRKPPFTLHPGQTAAVSLTYQVTDCAAATSAGSFNVAVRVERPWGTQTVGIAVPETPASSADGLPAGTEVRWQRELAGQACRVDHP